MVLTSIYEGVTGVAKLTSMHVGVTIIADRIFLKSLFTTHGVERWIEEEEGKEAEEEEKGHILLQAYEKVSLNLVSLTHCILSLGM